MRLGPRAALVKMITMRDFGKDGAMPKSIAPYELLDDTWTR